MSITDYLLNLESKMRKGDLERARKNYKDASSETRNEWYDEAKKPCEKCKLLIQKTKEQRNI